MKLITVDYLPEADAPRPYKKVADIIKEFVNMNVRYVKCEFGTLEYVSSYCAYQSIWRCLSRAPIKYPVKLQVIGGELYLIRTDMEG